MAAEIDDRIRDLELFCAQQEPMLGSMDKKLDRLLEAIYGNGSPGMKSQVAVLETSVNRFWLWLGGISLALLGIAAYIIQTRLT